MIYICRWQGLLLEGHMFLLVDCPSNLSLNMMLHRRNHRHVASHPVSLIASHRACNPRVATHPGVAHAGQVRPPKVNKRIRHKRNT